VDDLFRAKKSPRWHYESRVKGEQSFALKLETGRDDPRMPEDLFGATLVVENYTKRKEAEEMVSELFTLVERRPANPKKTHLRPHSFDFDELRIYVKWRDEPSQKPTGLDGRVFEVQIKTFLQHAWGIATHDLIYKTDQINWGLTRVAYQVKAMLENAELSISEANRLTDSSMLDRTDGDSESVAAAATQIRSRWPPEALPKDMVRLTANLLNLIRVFQLTDSAELWTAIDQATELGRGAKTLNLSPYSAMIDALIGMKGATLFSKLKTGKHRLFIPKEITLPDLPTEILKNIVTT
jgi:hypothetical protein